jgi:hypothetical protein
MWEVHINVSQIPMKMRYAMTSLQGKPPGLCLKATRSQLGEGHGLQLHLETDDCQHLLWLIHLYIIRFLFWSDMLIMAFKTVIRAFKNRSQSRQLYYDLQKVTSL